MKKILLAIFLSVALLAVTGGVALAQVGSCCTDADCIGTDTCEGERSPCLIDLDTGNFVPGPAVGGNPPGLVGSCVGSTPGVVTGGGGPPQKLKDYCELGSDVTIKSGIFTDPSGGCVIGGDGDSCTKALPCVFQKGCTVGKIAGAPAPTSVEPDATVNASIDSWGMVCLLNTVHSVTN